MKLLSCHIENYGKISGKDFKFNSDLTAFCEENGYGKTTLASFVKAMFYGLDTHNKNAEFSERRHFYPFAGGNFGGSLTFEADGKTYKIERTFDDKSATQDKLTMYCNGMPFTCELTPGQQFFGINRESFERTAFISGNDVEMAATDSVKTKLSNLVEGGTDDSSYDKASKLLEEMSKQYLPARGNGGLINDEANRLNGLSAEIADKQAVAATLPQLYAQHSDLQKQIAEVQQRVTDAQTANTLLANWEHYDGLLKSVEAKKRDMGSINDKYNSQIPIREELNEVKNAIAEAKTAEAKLSQKSFTDEDERKFAQLSAKFASGVPTNEDIAAAQNLIDKQASAKMEAKTLSEPQYSEKEKQLMQRFAQAIPTDQDIAEVTQLREAYRDAEQRCEALPDSVSTSQNSDQSSKKYLILAILSALVLVGGVAAIFFNTAIGAVLLAVGAVGLVATGFLYLNRKVSGARFTAENPEKTAAKAQRDAAAVKIRQILAKYGYASDGGAAFDASTFLTDVENLHQMAKRVAEDKVQIVKYDKYVADCEAQLNEFFSKYGVEGGSNRDKLALLQQHVYTFRDLSNRKQTWNNANGNLRQTLAENNAKVAQFAQKHSISADEQAIETAEKDAATYNRLKDEIAAEQRNAELFKEEKALTQRPAENVDLSALNSQLSDLQSRANALHSRITETEDDVAKLGDLQNAYDECQAKLASFKEKHALITKTADYLKRADDALKNKYVNPVRQRFVNYTQYLEKALGEKIIMSPDFTVRFEQNGKERSDRHLSSGQRTLIALCFRLALIDSMYSAEKPFIVLDDPFVTLDENHLAKARDLLKNVAQNVQIVYFACHPSRSL